jgi:hypothetical protein
MNFDLFTNTIIETHTSLQQSTVKAINIHLTIRNWRTYNPSTTKFRFEYSSNSPIGDWRIQNDYILIS